MGFDILPYEEGDEDIYDAFPITSEEPWNPHKFRHINHSKCCLPDDFWGHNGKQEGKKHIVDRECGPRILCRRHLGISALLLVSAIRRRNGEL